MENFTFDRRMETEFFRIFCISSSCRKAIYALCFVTPQSLCASPRAQPGLAVAVQGAEAGVAAWGLAAQMGFLGMGEAERETQPQRVRIW